VPLGLNVKRARLGAGLVNIYNDKEQHRRAT
jgi:hypothetical protein